MSAQHSHQGTQKGNDDCDFTCPEIVEQPDGTQKACGKACPKAKGHGSAQTCSKHGNY
jgi:hypothetical protein